MSSTCSGSESCCCLPQRAQACPLSLASLDVTSPCPVGGTVWFRQSHRYQLLGGVTEGDVSLTIIHAQRSDSGVYGCRVEIPGWFNDLKVNIQLVIEEGPVESLSTQNYMIPTGGQETSASEKVGKDDPAVEFITTEKQFKDLKGMENIGRMAALFIFTIIIILVFIFSGRRFLLRGTQRHTENDYENIQML
ncbi:hypothetical protein LDENG_00294710 [Lucifuga dentata]|nr:hypothetical protein LDENG_00294710 [Lucifuga dentata]